MKTTRLLRMLSLLGFLLLLTPFYDHCNGRGMKMAEANAEATVDSTAVETDSVRIDTTEVNKIEVDTINNFTQIAEIPFYEKAYDFIDDDDSENAFEIAILNKGYFNMTFDEFEKDISKGIKDNDYTGFFFGLKNFCFLLITIITLLISFFSFKNFKWVHKLSRVNLILLLITVICLFLEGLFETITQIKWGYYAFIITNLLIFYYSKKNKSQILNRNS